jgi:hypothetical protein
LKVQEFTIIFTVGENKYSIEIDIEDFDFGEGEYGFIADSINAILKNEKRKFLFYEMPPDAQTTSYIFVEPSKYKNAIELGLIPYFMVCFAVNY